MEALFDPERDERYWSVRGNMMERYQRPLIALCPCPNTTTRIDEIDGAEVAGEAVARRLADDIAIALKIESSLRYNSSGSRQC